MVAAGCLRFRTNVDDWVDCDAAHRLRFEAAADGGLTPYLHVRADLWAKVTRALYYDLVDMGEERVVDGRPDVRRRIGRRVFCDGGCGAGEGRALNEPMLKTDPAAISSAEFFDRARARLRFDVPPGLVDPNIIPQERRSRHRPHAGDRRARTADSPRGGIDPGGRPSAADRAVDAALGPPQRSRRPDFLSRRQDRRDRCLAARRRAARGRGGDRP